MSVTYNPRDTQEASFEESAVKIPTPDKDTLTGSRKRTNIKAAILMTLLCLVGAVVMLVPLYMMLTLSLKTDQEVQLSPWSLPKNPQWINYAHTWQIPGTDVSFANFFKNSLTIAILTTIGTTLSSSFVAYGFARLRFPGRDRLFVLLLSTMMLPSIITLMPSYIGFRYLHWIDTLYPLIVPSFFAGAFNVFLLRQFFLTIPRDLDDAARIDGASFFQIFWKILLPLTKPALVTVSLFAFIYAWKDLMAPLIYLNSPENQTLELGLRTFLTIHNTDWNLLMAGSVMVMIPLLVIFFVGQRYFVQGIVMQGLKD